MLKTTRSGFSNGIFIVLGGVAVLIIVLTIFFLVKRRREKGVL